MCEILKFHGLAEVAPAAEERVSKPKARPVAKCLGYQPRDSTCFTSSGKVMR